MGSTLDKVAQIVPVNVAAPVASGCPSTSAAPGASSGGPAAATLVPFPPVPPCNATGASGTAVSLAPEGMLTKVQLALVAAETGHKVKLESLDIKDVRDALIKHSPHDKYFNGALDACLKRHGVKPPKPRPAKVDALLACVTGIQPEILTVFGMRSNYVRSRAESMAFNFGFVHFYAVYVWGSCLGA